ARIHVGGGRDHAVIGTYAGDLGACEPGAGVVGVAERGKGHVVVGEVEARGQLGEHGLVQREQRVDTGIRGQRQGRLAVACGKGGVAELGAGDQANGVVELDHAFVGVAGDQLQGHRCIADVELVHQLAAVDLDVVVVDL